MGWWSSEIMGGDEPLDILYVMAQTIGAADGDGWHGFAWPTTLSAVDVGALAALLDDAQFARGHDQSVAAQVFALLALRLRAPIGEALRERLRGLIERDVWAQTDAGRRAKIKRLVADLADHR